MLHCRRFYQGNLQREPGRRLRTGAVSKLPMRQLTSLASALVHVGLSKLPIRQLTVGFYANILMLPKLASVYSYLTPILCAC